MAECQVQITAKCENGQLVSELEQPRWLDLFRLVIAQFGLLNILDLLVQVVSTNRHVDQLNAQHNLCKVYIYAGRLELVDHAKSANAIVAGLEVCIHLGD